MTGLEQCIPTKNTGKLISEWLFIMVLCLGILGASFAYADSKTPLVTPGIDDNHFWLHHWQEVQVFFGTQAVIFVTWVCVQIYNSFIKAKDKTLDTVKETRDLVLRMQEDIKNIKYSMVSKGEAHEMIQSEIKYANELRGTPRN